MPELIAAALILWVLFVGLRWFARADPKVLARGVKRGAGGALLATAAALLVFRGNPEAAAALGAIGLWLLGWRETAPAFMRHFGGRGGGARILRSRTLEMQIDPTTGEIRGRVLAGRFAGRALADLSEAECVELASECRAVDPDGDRFLKFYVDRRFAGGRAADEDYGDARRREGPRASAMTEDYAYQMLGLPKGASREEITRAHRMLMKKVHPDHGGTASLAALLNEAKDVLLRRH